MPNCTAYGKKEFLKAMESMLQDDDIVLISSFVSNYEMKGKPKNKVKVISTMFPAASFKKQEGVNDLTKSDNWSMVVGKIDMFSNEIEETIEYQKKYWNREQNVQECDATDAK